MNDRALDRLFRRFRERHDGAALAAVFDATSRELYDVACHLIRDAALAEDLVQATFLAAIRRAAEYDGQSPVKGWLYGILWREAAKLRRTSARRVDPHRLEERVEPEPIERMLASEVPAAVERALGKLPARYREVVEPLVVRGVAPEEIARALRRAPGTVRSQIHRGMERLRRLLPREFVPLPGVAAIELRGLASVRGEVLRAGGFSPSAIGSVSALSVSATIGGLVMSKTMFVAAAAAVSVAMVAWFASDGDAAAHADPPLAEAPARVEAPATAVSAGEDDAPTVLDLAGSRREIEGSAAVESAPADLQDEIARWLARFRERPDDWRHGLEVAYEIAKLPPDRALAVMRGVWPDLSAPVKEQVLKPFVFGGGHVHALKVLHLAATDATLSVQGRAFAYLRSYAFEDFATDYEAYGRWAATYRDMPVKDVLVQNAQRFVADLRALPPDELAQRIRSFERLDLDTGGPAGVDLARVIKDAGGLQVISACLEGEDAKAKRAALAWSKTLRADEAWLRAWVLPTIEHADGVDAGVLDASFGALGRPECKWARDPILDHLRRAAAIAQPTEAEIEAAARDGTPPSRAVATADAARALADIGDPAAIPAMIEILAQDRSGRLAYDVGYFGLAKLTGVKWQESYDAAWWLDWWDKNYRRLPPEVQSIPIRR